MNYIWEDDATKLTKELRIFFILLFSSILLSAVFGNLAAIWLALHRKHRLLYKCCVISLSTSDGLMAISTCSYSISMFVHPWINWTMGEFMCKFVPFVQTVAVLSNSFTLSSIAMDRYQGVVNAINGRWNPTLPACLGVIITIWTIAIVASIPMFLEYYIEPVFVLKYDKEHHQISSYTLVDFCSVTSKQRMSIYISLLFALIFLPLLITFLILYGMIGSFIWMRRPVSSKPTSGEGEAVSICRKKETEEGEACIDGKGEGREVTTESSSAAAATTTLTSLSSPEQPPQRPATPQPSHPHENSRVSQSEKRKKRILKIIFALMLTFFLTRLPIWCLNLVSSNTSLVGKKWWILQYFLSALSLLGTVLNPFLYGFLQESMSRGKQASFLYCLCPFGKGNRTENVRGQRCPHMRPPAENCASNKPLAGVCGTAEERPRVKPWSIT